MKDDEGVEDILTETARLYEAYLAITALSDALALPPQLEFFTPTPSVPLVTFC